MAKPKELPFAQAIIEQLASTMTGSIDSITNTVMQRAAIEMQKQGLPNGFAKDYAKIRAAIRSSVADQMTDMMQGRIKALA